MNKFPGQIKRVCALLLAFLILTLSSCTLVGEMLTASRLEKLGYKTEYGLDGEFEDPYLFSHEDEVTALLSEIEALTRKNDSSDAPTLLSLYDRLEEALYVVLDHKNLVYIDFCKTPGDDSIFSEYTRLSSFVTDAARDLYLLYGAIYESNLSSAFYKDWAEEDIKEALYLCKTYSGEFARITKERDELVSLYEKLDRSSFGFNDKSAVYYHRIVSKNRQLAQLAGYEDYPSYADEKIYERDYSKEQIEAFSNYVKDYMVPLAEKIYKDMKRNVGGTAYGELSLLTDYDLSFSLMEETLTPYYEMMGADFSDGFSSFTKSVYTADSKKSSPAAFTVYQQNQNKPLCYFGPDYQDLSTYVHEQGHYLAFYFSECTLSSIDLCETHSQSNEWLYLAYAERYYDEKIYDDLTAYYLLNNLVTMIVACCCDSFERAVYADDTLQPDDYDDLFVSCAGELGAYSFLKSYMGSNLTTYWHHAVVSNSMYYLSYSVSLVPSIEFFLIAKEDGFDEASDIYRDLCTVDQDTAFLETVISSSLSSPFEEEIFKKISSGFKIS